MDELKASFPTTPVVWVDSVVSTVNAASGMVRVLVGVTVTVMVVVENNVVVDVTSSLVEDSSSGDRLVVGMVPSPGTDGPLEKKVVVVAPVMVYIVPLTSINVVVSTTPLSPSEMVIVVSVTVVPGATVVGIAVGGVVGTSPLSIVIVNVEAGKVVVVSGSGAIAVPPVSAGPVLNVDGPRSDTVKKPPGTLNGTVTVTVM